MSYRIKVTSNFDKKVKRIAKKHKGIKADISALIANLKINPQIGTDLGQNLYKIRIAVTGTNKGKSGGARIITCVVVVSETVILSEIYLKNENDTVDVGLVIKQLEADGFI